MKTSLREGLLNRISWYEDIQETYEWEFEYPPCPFDKPTIKNITQFINMLPEHLLSKIDIDTITPSPHATFNIVCYTDNKELNIEIGDILMTYYTHTSEYERVPVNENTLKELISYLEQFYIQ